MISFSLLFVLVLCSVVGAFTGLVLGDLVGHLYLAMIAGVFATIIAIAARNIRIPQLVVVYSALAIERPIPSHVIIYSIVTALIAGAAAVGIATEANLTSSVMIGALGGLFAGLLMAMLMFVYDTAHGHL
jgi:hypothetical protein